MGKLISSWLRLITSAGAPPEDVVDSAETADEGDIHLMKGLVCSGSPLYSDNQLLETQ
jgi:hypothetical protein